MLLCSGFNTLHIMRSCGAAMTRTSQPTGAGHPQGIARGLDISLPEFYEAFMKCKARWCDLESGHTGKCQRLTIAINGDEPAINTKESKPAHENDTQRTRNRRTRQAYNEYMREYMKLRRAGFIGIAYG